MVPGDGMAWLVGVAGVKSPTTVWFPVAVYVAVARKPELPVLPLLLLLRSPVMSHLCSQGREPTLC